MLASELYAKIHNYNCEGEDRCHWCGAACKRVWPHDDPPPQQGSRWLTTAKFPGNSYVCMGCWLFRHKSVTANYLRGDFFQDRRCFEQISWVLTDQGKFGIEHGDAIALYEFLLKPPLKFCLALKKTAPTIRLHSAVVNELTVIKGDSNLQFTLDNEIMSYTPYELQESLSTHETAGMQLGVRSLVDLLGFSAVIEKVPSTQDHRGRPNIDELKTREKMEETRIKPGKEVTAIPKVALSTKTSSE